MAIVSGEVQEDNGVFRGATDFSEYTTDPLPQTGLTELGDLANGAAEIVDESGQGEGNALELFISNENTVRYGVGIDLFTGFFPLEILARIFFDDTDPNPGSNLWFAGPMYGMFGADGDGFERAEGGTVRDDAAFIGGMFQDGGAVSVGGATALTDVTLGEWGWIRIRTFDDPPVERWVKAWTGDISDEPASFQVMAGAQLTELEVEGGLMGFGGINMARPAFQENRRLMAFLSFTTDPDPDTNPPPTPSELISVGDIIPPTVTITNLQATFVEAAGSAFEVAT